MPRRPSLAPAKEYKVYLNQDNSAKLELLTYDPERHRARFGEVSRIANEAFKMYFASIKKEPANGES
jgi:hypothetical protein